MDRETADRLAFVLVVFVVLVGGLGALYAFWRARTADGMMGRMMIGTAATNPVAYLFATLIAVSAVVGAYALGRDHLPERSSTDQGRADRSGTRASTEPDPESSGPGPESSGPGPNSSPRSNAGSSAESDSDPSAEPHTDSPAESGPDPSVKSDRALSAESGPDQPAERTPGDRAPRPPALLPEDERRIVRPILESPGLTQVELRGRSDFSKAKVSQTVSELEDRGLIYRERQGRTYRVYPGKLLEEEWRSDADDSSR